MQGNHLINANRFLGWALALFLVAGPGFAATITGQVVAVSDGDTLTVLDADRAQHKIRLSGIDAPEKAQAFGERSKQNLSRLVFGKEIEVQWNKRDRYGRIVGKVLVAEVPCKAGDCPKTVDACLSQITAGLAWWYRDYANKAFLRERIDLLLRGHLADRPVRANEQEPFVLGNYGIDDQHIPVVFVSRLWDAHHADRMDTALRQAVPGFSIILTSTAGAHHNYLGSGMVFSIDSIICPRASARWWRRVWPTCARVGARTWNLRQICRKSHNRRPHIPLASPSASCDTPSRCKHPVRRMEFQFGW